MQEGEEGLKQRFNASMLRGKAQQDVIIFFTLGWWGRHLSFLFLLDACVGGQVCWLVGLQWLCVCVTVCVGKRVELLV
jgi:hypothetical protein